MVSVTIPLYNQSHLTKRCLASLLAHSQETKELILVDNASKDDTPQVLESFRPLFEAKGIRFQVITNEKNEGFGRACNAGIFAATGEWIAVLNNDTWLMPGWDRALRESAERLQADMVGPYYDEGAFDESRLLDFGAKFSRRNRNRARKSWVSILMFFRRDSVLEVKGFDPEYFVTYEDFDLKLRMDLKGMRYFKVGSCVIWHHSQGTRKQASLPKDYEIEGLKIFMRKWGFDPRKKDSAFLSRFMRKLEKFRNRLGYL